MRWVIGWLLVANLVLFLWWITERNPTLQPVALPQPDVGNLTLLDEAGTPADNTGAGAEDEPPGPESVARNDEKQAVTPALPAGAAGKTPKPAVSKQTLASAVAQAEKPEKDLGEIPLDGSSPKTPSKPAAVTPPNAVSAKPPAPTTGEPPRRKPASPVFSCWALGPFEEESQARSLPLPEGVRRLKVRHSRTREPAGFYVLIPPQPDRAAALAIVRRLKEKGVRDFWLFGSGPLKNAISLGMFTRQENAERRRRETQRLGFDVEVRRRYRSLEGVLIHVRGPATAATERMLRSISANQIRPIECPRQP